MVLPTSRNMKEIKPRKAFRKKLKYIKIIKTKRLFNAKNLHNVVRKHIVQGTYLEKI